MHKFKLPIGDWSEDGHAKCDRFIVDSSVTAEELVPIYIDMDKRFDVGSVAKSYEEDWACQDFVERIIKAGLSPEKYFEQPDEGRWTVTSSKALAQLVLDLLMAHDSTLDLKIVEEDLPEFNNWLGHKVQGVSGGDVFSLPGYGMF